MGIVDRYMTRANEIIGDRTPGEAKYDSEIVRWLRKGKSIQKAILKANEKFPEEALEPSEEHYADLPRYEYIAEHEAILEKVKQPTGKAGRQRW
jgi:hypothetical protein